MKEPAPRSQPRLERAYLLAAVLVSGGATLTLEVLGTRVISPYFGSSLYTWAALITVTLAALAAGYAMGGRQADRDPSLLLFSSLLSWAAVAVALIPLARSPVLRWTSPLGVQLGTLASATLLMAPSLSLLGALGPIAVRLTASAVQGVGRVVGDVYGVSTAGSVIGALAAGFVLIPNFSVTSILYATALVLLALSAAGFALAARRAPLRQAALAAALLGAAAWPRPAPQAQVLLRRESPYGRIKVVDFPTDEGTRRYLMVNGTSQSVARVPAGVEPVESDSPYIHALELAALARPLARRALAIGLGAGLLPSALEREHGVATDVIEIDPAIQDTARAYFGFAPRGALLTEDGRVALERLGGRYEIVILDAFGGELPPAHLLTAEAFKAIRERLAPGGVVAVNMVSLVAGPGDEAWRAAFKTLRTVFPGARAFLGGPPFRGIANVLLFASDDPLDVRRALARARPVARDDLAFALDNELTPSPAELAGVPVLTDDFAPVEAMLARTTLVWRASLIEMIEPLLLD